MEYTLEKCFVKPFSITAKQKHKDDLRQNKSIVLFSHKIIEKENGDKVFQNYDPILYLLIAHSEAIINSFRPQRASILPTDLLNFNSKHCFC